MTRTCRICGASGPLATATGKLCATCAEERTRSKVRKASRPKAPVGFRWQTALPGRGFGEPVVVGPEVFAPVEPVQPTRPVTRIRAADADEREQREREWAEWLSRRRRDE